MHAPRAPESVRRQPPASPGRRAVVARRPAFTLIELVVVLTIVTILASLTLGGLAVTRQRAQIDKTKSTIRKIHEAIVPHYESYVRRRVSMKGSTSYPSLPEERLRRMRALVMFEMPDSWNDVGFGGDGTGVEQNRLFITQDDGSLTPSTLIPTDFAWTGVTRGYAAYHHAMRTASGGTDFRRTYPSSECLYMIVSRGLGEPDIMEQFRADEIGDVDGDKVPEFIDGWGQPIAFIRWPVGFPSPLQSQNASLQPDPFDPLRVSALVAYPPTIPTPQRDYAVTPLIVSGGPDGTSTNYGVEFRAGWHPVLVSSPSPPPLTLRVVPPGSGPDPNPGAINNADIVADNVTNHDLLAK
jgi:prepilin-type N-terminal cleavage/methylation domain-containing protein